MSSTVLLDLLLQSPCSLMQFDHRPLAVSTVAACTDREAVQMPAASTEASVSATR